MGLTSAWNGLIDFVFQPNEIQKLNGSFFYVIKGGLGDDNELDFRLLYKIYRKIPHLRAVIDKRSTLFSNGKLVVKDLDSEDKILYDHDLQKRLDSPNVFQSTKEWMFMIEAYRCLSGDAFIYKNQIGAPRSRNLKALTPIDYDSMKVDTYSNVLPFEVEKRSDYIRSIQFNFGNGSTRTFNRMTGLDDQIIHFRDSGIKFTEAHSRIHTLRLPITNIYKALKARGVLIDKKGGIGALTGASNKAASGNDVNVPMGKKEKEAIQERLTKFGLGDHQDSIIVTDTPLKWQPFVYPTKELMLFEEIEDDFHQLCDGYDIRRELFDGQTNYSNKEHAERGTYQDTIIPAWEEFANKLNTELKTADEGIKICVDYSHIAVLQKDKKAEADTDKVKSDMHLNELRDKIITRQEYRDMMEYGGKVPEEEENPADEEAADDEAQAEEEATDQQ